MKGWRARDLSDYLSAKTQDGGVWELSGELVAMGTGRTLAKVQGVEEVVCAKNVHRHSAKYDQETSTSLALPGSPKTPPKVPILHSAQIVSRKTLFYVDPLSGEQMAVFRYRPTAPPRPVSPILVPPVKVVLGVTADSQLLVARASPGSEKETRASLKQAILRSVVTMPPLRPFQGILSIRWTFIGRGVAHSTSSKTPNRPGVVEEYHYVLGKQGGAGSWVRVGRCPSWYGSGQCMMNIRSVRVKGGLNGLDKNVKTWMKEINRFKTLRAEDADSAVVHADNLPSRRSRLFGIF